MIILSVYKCMYVRMDVSKEEDERGEDDDD
jgi:hypothetical protein